MIRRILALLLGAGLAAFIVWLLFGVGFAWTLLEAMGGWK